MAPHSENANNVSSKTVVSSNEGSSCKSHDIQPSSSGSFFSPEGPSSSGCGAIELFDANEQKHCFSGSCMCSPEKEILQRYLSHIKVNKSAEQPGRGIYLSRICDMTLTEFILARKLYCKMQVHSRWEECTQCLPLIKLANEISGHGLCQVSSLFKNLFSSNRYRSERQSGN